MNRDIKIAKLITKEDLLHKKTMFVFNLEPRKLLGLDSEAMLLAADDGHNMVKIMKQSLRRNQ